MNAALVDLSPRGGDGERPGQDGGVGALGGAERRPRNPIRPVHPQRRQAGRRRHRHAAMQ
ncbi:MAG: hypothetical protein MZW92_09490 [Comamonadaceae bacterium]|nr:hypothetical protein [Comamonadaceae bacterium]